MKANRKCLISNDKGDVGVGTLIIFIAMILVAAVAATVLIYTTGALQQKATKTSTEATQQISSNIVVDKVFGDRLDNTSNVNDNIQKLLIRIKPDVGTTSVDLRQVIVTVMDRNNRYDLTYSNNGSQNTDNSTGTYTATPVRDVDNSFNASKNTPVIDSGGLVELEVDLGATPGITLDTRKTFWVTLNQQVGQAINLEITTPDSFGVNRYVQLYP